MYLRILFYLFMVLMLFGVYIAIDIKAWFFWVSENYGRATAYGAVTAFSVVLAVIFRIYGKLDDKTR